MRISDWSSDVCSSDLTIMNSLATYSGGLAAGDPAFWLPLVFMGLMGFAILAYVFLDGFDLGVSILLNGAAEDASRTTRLAYMGPFWYANETWPVLGIGSLMVVFQFAYGGRSEVRKSELPHLIRVPFAC